jgi:signal transduction histidine kinase
MLLREPMPTEGARTDLETIVEAARRGRVLVQQILAFSRKEEAAKASVDLAAIVRQSLSMLRATTPTTLRIEQHLEHVPPILGDAGQLQQVVVNLLTNAAHAIGMERGQITVRLTHEFTPEAEAQDGDGTALRLTVSDTGSGMDSRTVDRIFEPFFTTKPVGEGTGLGLSVVHGIVTAHRGKIEVQSAPGKGSVFMVVLPAALPLQPQIQSAAA